jgi:hypothetical protein
MGEGISLSQAIADGMLFHESGHPDTILCGLDKRAKECALTRTLEPVRIRDEHVQPLSPEDSNIR